MIEARSALVDAPRRVKREGRALQKAFRSYGGDWHKLTDLVRASLEFATLPDMAACLRELADHAELRVLASSAALLSHDCIFAQRGRRL